MDPEAGGAQQPLLESSAGANAEAKAVEHWSRNLARSLYSSATHVGTSALLGLITAICLKTLGQTIAIALVLLFIGFQVLAYYGFVNFNWSRVGATIGNTLEITDNGKVNIERVKTSCVGAFTWILSWGVLSIVGFLAGFYVGWKVLG